MIALKEKQVDSIEIINSSLKYIADLLEGIKSVEHEFSSEIVKIDHLKNRTRTKEEEEIKRVESFNLEKSKQKILKEKINQIKEENNNLLSSSSIKKNLLYYVDTIKDMYDIFIEDVPTLHISFIKEIQKAMGIKK